MSFDFTRYAVDGAMRPDSFSGLDQGFSSALASMFSAAPPEIAQHLRSTSGFRSPERQAQLYQDALKKYGTPEKARKWVAPLGRSNHNHGHAIDLKYLDPYATKWVHENAGGSGCHFHCRMKIGILKWLIGEGANLIRHWLPARHLRNLLCLCRSCGSRDKPAHDPVSMRIRLTAARNQSVLGGSVLRRFSQPVKCSCIACSIH